MNDKRKLAIAKILWAICIAGIVVQLAIWIFTLVERPSQVNVDEGPIWGSAITLGFSVLGMLIITRQPGNRVGWLVMLGALAWANPIPTWLAYLVNPPAAITPVLWPLIWFDNWSWILIVLPFFLIPLHFPTGRPPSPRWDWVNRLAIGMWLFSILFVTIGDEMGPYNSDWVLPNPIGFFPIAAVEGPFVIIWGIGLATLASASVISLFVRYRRAKSVERQQIKWLLYAAALFVVLFVVEYILAGPGQFGSVNWLDLMFALSILAFPVAIAIAILRYRLYDIDVIIRKTLVYAVVSGLLILAYFSSVVVLQSLLLTGTGESSPIAIVVSTLLIAVLFNPLRRRVQDAIDRRFYRRKYNAAQALGSFAATARNEVDLERLIVALVALVDETMQPEHISLWLKTGPEKDRFTRAFDDEAGLQQNQRPRKERPLDAV